MKPTKKYFTLFEVTEITGISHDILSELINKEWVRPSTPSPEIHLDQEDISRVHLILELKRDFGVNDESIPIILHLLDQLYFLRDQVSKTTNH